MQRAFATSLVVEKKYLAVAQHDVAGLKVAIEEVLVGSGEQELRQAAEVLLQGLFAKRDSGQTQKVIFEIIQVPSDGLAIETRPRVADFVIQIASSLDLKARQDGQGFSVGFNDSGGNPLTGTIFRKELK